MGHLGLARPTNTSSIFQAFQSLVFVPFCSIIFWFQSEKKRKGIEQKVTKETKERVSMDSGGVVVVVLFQASVVAIVPQARLIRARIGRLVSVDRELIA